MIGSSVRGGRRRMLAGLAVVSTVAVVGGALAVVAVAGRPEQAQRADATQALARTVASTAAGAGVAKWWGVASKNVTVGRSETRLASIAVPAGSYQMIATGSLWTTGGKGFQDIGCHISVGKIEYGHSYVTLSSSGINQEPFAVVGIGRLNSQTSVELRCVLGNDPLLSVTAQGNLVVTKVG